MTRWISYSLNNAGKGNVNLRRKDAKNIILTSVKPCMNRIVHNTATLSNDIAPIISKFKNDDSAMDVPKIFVAGKIDAKKPAGICVIK